MANGSIPTHTLLSEEPSHAEGPSPSTHGAPTPGPANTRKRKGKAVSATPYALKRQLDDKEAKKIATAPAVTQDDIPPAVTVVKTPPPPGAPATTKTKPTHTPSPRPRTSTLRPQTSPPRSKAAPTTPDNTTTKHGIVVHGIALGKDLGNVRRWLEASNTEIGKTTGISWLRKKTILLEEGKKTSSAVVYLETQKDIGKVKLGGKWLRTSEYEQDRGRK
ncbi:hypothetical protein BDZ91DRAFT_795192 [Kalaharituber pfeilii]|nr:hypothetical protein BDZ91DRAFT_795192 [Kalaharituber pfeilii]